MFFLRKKNIKSIQGFFLDFRKICKNFIKSNKKGTFKKVTQIKIEHLLLNVNGYINTTKPSIFLRK